MCSSVNATIRNIKAYTSDSRGAANEMRNIMSLHEVDIYNHDDVTREYIYTYDLTCGSYHKFFQGRINIRQDDYFHVAEFISLDVMIRNSEKKIHAKTSITELSEEGNKEYTSESESDVYINR